MHAEPTEPVAAEPEPLAVPLIRISADDEDAIDRVVRDGLAAGGVPGAVVVIGRSDGIVFQRAYGRRAIDPAPEPMTLDTIFDLASITKAVATATSAMVLTERGDLSLDTRVATVLEGLEGGGRERITVEHLLTHTAGFGAVNRLSDYEGERSERIARVLATELEHPPGARVRYSDLSFIVLGELIAAVSGRPLDELAEAEVFAPLSMNDTGFRPTETERVAPTERAARRGGAMIRGEVHDPRAWRLGNVAGNAGLFSTGADLARFARAMLDGGAPVLERSTLDEMIRPRRLVGGSRALGWDVGRVSMSARAFGHGGYTGTSLWIDPARDVFVVFLSNRVHPDGSGDVQPLLRALMPRAVEAARRAAPLVESDVRSGVDVLAAEGFAPLAGRRVAVLTHRAARTRDGDMTLYALHRAPDVTVVRALAPEHGLGVDREGRIRDSVEPVTGVPVHGLFGPVREPTDAMLDGVDAIVIDLQTVGVRFYTYAATVTRVLRAAAARGLPVWLLDRPDPLAAGPPRGPVSEPALASFVNHHPLPTVHAMTLGELAELVVSERSIDVNLTVVPVEGWTRDGWPEGHRWLPPSPNLRTLSAVALYPALALVEGTNVSVGRGTDRPFEQVGAPWVDADALAEAMSRVPGLSAEPVAFTPRSARHRGERCHGVSLRIDDPEAYRPVRAGLALAIALRSHDAWEPARVERMLGHRAIYQAFAEGASVSELERAWSEELDGFAARRARFLRYDRSPSE